MTLLLILKRGPRQRPLPPFVARPSTHTPDSGSVLFPTSLIRY